MGGNGNIVHIDKTVLVKRKFHKDEILSKEDKWAVNSVNINTKEIIMMLSKTIKSMG